MYFLLNKNYSFNSFLEKPNTMLGKTHKFTSVYIGLLLISVCFFINVQGSLPTAPEMPEKFSSQQQYREYINKVKEYYEIINRPRWGRRSMPIDSTLYELDPKATTGFLGENILGQNIYKYDNKINEQAN